MPVIEGLERVPLSVGHQPHGTPTEQDETLPQHHTLLLQEGQQVGQVPPEEVSPGVQRQVQTGQLGYHVEPVQQTVEDQELLGVDQVQQHVVQHVVQDVVAGVGAEEGLDY